ncbi:centrosomal protein of 290 kDa-like [Poeciliopsis prolifica]|uniref:centrosomal protein of 290 kDa-like n=1 Tax=Poeciliopsis prolifica TaxID=188132 RepID=UPI002413AF00|nr:centrosomal protein of 290 kDa-like [Poeciliopsis prolifica]
MKRSAQESWSKARSDELTDKDPRSRLMGEGARNITWLSTRQEGNRGQKVQYNEKDLRTQLENMKKEMKRLEAKCFKLSNKNRGSVTKLREITTINLDLETQLKIMERSHAERTSSLLSETARRRELSDEVTTLKEYKERALDAEKLVKELMDNNQKLKIHLETSQQKAAAYKNESEVHKADSKKQFDLVRSRDHMICSLKVALDAKQKQIDAQKEELKRQRRVAQQTELEAKRNRQNEEASMKRIRHKDKENLSLRAEIRTLTKALGDSERKLSKQDSKQHILQEKIENAQTENAFLQKKTQTLESSTMNLDREVIETQTLLQKSQKENQQLKNQLEKVKIRLAETIQNSIENKTKFEKDLLRIKEDYMKLKMEREDVLTKNRRATEALYCNDRKIGIQTDIIREQECRIIELCKEVLRLNENAQKFKMVKETYSKVEKLGLDEETGDLIILPEDNKKLEKLRMYRIENHRLSKQLEEKESEIKDLKLEEEKLLHVVKNLRSKLDRLPEDAMDKVQESQTNVRELKRQIQVQEAEISVYVKKIQMLEIDIKKLKNKPADISFSKKDTFLPIPLKNIKLKSEDTKPKTTKKPLNIVYLPPLQISSYGKAKNSDYPSFLEFLDVVLESATPGDSLVLLGALQRSHGQRQVAGLSLRDKGRSLVIQDELRCGGASAPPHRDEPVETQASGGCLSLLDASLVRRVG